MRELPAGDQKVQPSSKDMLVRVCTLASDQSRVQSLLANGIVVRRALVPEKTKVVAWVKRHFPQYWADECEVSFSSHPVRCYLATKESHAIGFCAYDAIALGVVGPLGVDPEHRNIGIGRALIIETLSAMRAAGYAYVILGWIPPKHQSFYQDFVSATVVGDSVPREQMYFDLLRE